MTHWAAPRIGCRSKRLSVVEARLVSRGLFAMPLSSCIWFCILTVCVSASVIGDEEGVAIPLFDSFDPVVPDSGGWVCDNVDKSKPALLFSTKDRTMKLPDAYSFGCVWNKRNILSYAELGNAFKGKRITVAGDSMTRTMVYSPLLRMLKTNFDDRKPQPDWKISQEIKECYHSAASSSGSWGPKEFK